ncbi:MAG: hypothetical protein AAFR61_14305 [Bacteroidota bacterium]
MKQSAVPWIVVALMAVYVYGLTYHAKTRAPREPVYDFYDTACVSVFIQDQDLHDVYGQYNNILEGQRQLVKATKVGNGPFKLTFQVNSPRPATLYIDDEPVEIFLVPGDTSLIVTTWFNQESYYLDSLDFIGKMSGICQYYLRKQKEFERLHLRNTPHIIASEDMVDYAGKLDSMAAKELSFLVQQGVYSALPDWFVNFERAEILYQKAYLKLSASFNREGGNPMVDDVPLDNQAAVFSYYYYLYLNTFFAQTESEGKISSPDPDQIQQSHLKEADMRLSEGPHDVFLTRAIFARLDAGNLDLAGELLEQFEDTFYSKKYVRFLRMQLEKRNSL